GPAAAALVDGAVLAPALLADEAGVPAVLVDTAPGPAHAATRTVARVSATKRAAGNAAWAGRNRTVTMECSSSLVSLPVAKPSPEAHPRPSFGGAVVARTTSSGVNWSTRGSTDRRSISASRISARRRPD